MKAIIIGASLSGKTTLIRYLRAISDETISEMDEELTLLNNGVFPTDNEQKHKILAPKVIQKVLTQDSILFFTNADYFSQDDLKYARNKGFTIVQLNLALEILKERNRARVQLEGYSDLDQWLEGMVQYQENIKDKGFVDKSINMDQPVEDIADELLTFLPK